MRDLENRMVIDSEWDEEEYGVRNPSRYEDDDERWFWGEEDEE